ncbi:MAG: hypothetical protein ACR2K6_01395, partial [Solirubrobacterales bacterium]
MDELVERLRTRAEQDPIRAVAGLLVGLGFLLVAIRAGTDFDGEAVSSFVQFLLVGTASTLLLVTGLAGALGRREDEPRSWPSIYLVAGVLLLPLALALFVDAIDETPDGTLVTLFIFGISAAVAFWLRFSTGVRYQMLIGAIFALIAWLALVDKILTGDLAEDADAFRALVLLFGFGLVFAATRIDGGGLGALRRPSAEAGDLLTVAGIAVLVVTVIGVIGSIAAFFLPFGGESLGAPTQNIGWDLLALLSGLALVVYAARTGLRGPGYIGAIVLLVFAYSVGLDLDDDSPEGKIFGWPLLVLLVGAGLFAYSLAGRGSIGSGGSDRRGGHGSTGSDGSGGVGPT